MFLQAPDWKFFSGNPATMKLFGVKDNAEFESLTGITGEHLMFMDVKNINVAIVITAVAISNIYIYRERMRKVPAKAGA